VTDQQVSETLKTAIAETVEGFTDQIRAKAADETRTDDIRLLHTAGYHDAAEYLRGAK
jgi:hypothetical protein